MITPLINADEMLHCSLQLLHTLQPFSTKTVISQFFQEPLSNHLVATKFLNIKTTNSTQSEMPHGTQLTYTQLHKQHSTLNMEQLERRQDNFLQIILPSVKLFHVHV
ncbi:hypothetical protein KC19_7G169900 [Ceratodon purpureus]|uniref:Uncharacterized protein n=1 Tax=Ceratodon purpureus TaxID=3225 RepID=A0A8T0HC63_CERPU|nr:hypothetical protein KC19_7G169900 [Ceratodon purpureus]